MPTFKVTAESPSGVHLKADYLIDVISSASIAQTGGGKDGVFTELRHGVGSAVGKRFAVGDSELDLTVHGKYSTENDYVSYIYGVDSSLTLDDKNTTLNLGLTRVDDHWEIAGPVAVGQSRTPSLGGFTTRAGVSQLLSPTLVLSGGYQLGVLEGFLGNPYRRALIGPLPHMENHPHERLRHNFDAHLAWFVPRTSTSFHLFYKAYIDSWSIAALTPELRVYQELGENFVARARYRYYVQDHAYFYESPRYPRGYTGPLTNDPKMAEFESQQLGLKLEYRLSFLARSIFDFAKETWLDLSFDRQWCTSSFGDNVSATAGARLPF
ncbi:MAG TPA: DUF3570 domain-containing protein [Polyangiales bacterium]